MSTDFPLSHLLTQADTTVITRVPLTKLDAPMRFSEPAGDEIAFCFLDVETTGLDGDADEVIEIGLLRMSYSPSANAFTSVDGMYSGLEQPSRPLTEDIQKITGLTDADLDGQRIDDNAVNELLSGDPIIVAHNAKFDRAFSDARLPITKSLRWVCSIEDINWFELGYNAKNLEMLLYLNGFYYDAHRALTDCQALAYLMMITSSAMPSLIAASEAEQIIVRAFGSPFDVKDTLKANGYRWHDGVRGGNKHWWTMIESDALEAEKDFLDQTYYEGSQRAHFQVVNARQRFGEI